MGLNSSTKKRVSKKVKQPLFYLYPYPRNFQIFNSQRLNFDFLDSLEYITTYKKEEIYLQTLKF